MRGRGGSSHQGTARGLAMMSPNRVGQRGRQVRFARGGWRRQRGRGASNRARGACDLRCLVAHRSGWRPRCRRNHPVHRRREASVRLAAVALAVTALWLATCVRLRQVIRQRDAAHTQLKNDGSGGAVAARLRDYAAEYSHISAELGDGLTPVDIRRAEDLQLDYSQITSHVNSKLRRYAPSYLSGWRSDPPGIEQEQLSMVQNLKRYCDYAVPAVARHGSAHRTRQTRRWGRRTRNTG